MFKPIRMVFIFSALMMLGGCAASRSVVSPDTAALAENPTQGIAVRIDQVSDLRRFEAAPKTPDIPSLGGGDVGNAALTVRAMGRKRNGFGLAMGDVMLPEGQTVSKMVEGALIQGFRLAGYRVLKPDDVGYEQAIPVTARVNEFWSWLDIGFSSLTIRNRANVNISGAVPALNGGMVATSEVSDKLMMVFEEEWTKIASRNLAQLSEKVRAGLSGK